MIAIEDRLSLPDESQVLDEGEGTGASPLHKVGCAWWGACNRHLQACGVASTFADIGPFVLRLTAECFTRRDLLLKASKAVLTTASMTEVLRRAVAAGHGTSFTYIAGLDDLDALRTGVETLAPYVTEFPNFQVYQAHNRIMAGLRASGALELEYYLRARAEIEKIMEPSGRRPTAWECYRPLWYFTFADETLVCA
ncbi:hypothetical protein [Streptomyces sp. NPDC058145]|uniref:hypothetical protein n=1 Tax=Streptomyces sp. NPDC058145 TaxID=3346356 RepID=UPI0036E0428C